LAAERPASRSCAVPARGVSATAIAARFMPAKNAEGAFHIPLHRDPAIRGLPAVSLTSCRQARQSHKRHRQDVSTR
jgi:hypothetical protein